MTSYGTHPISVSNNKGCGCPWGVPFSELRCQLKNLICFLSLIWSLIWFNYPSTSPGLFSGTFFNLSILPLNYSMASNTHILNQPKNVPTTSFPYFAFFDYASQTVNLFSILSGILRLWCCNQHSSKRHELHLARHVHLTLFLAFFFLSSSKAIHLGVCA